MCFYLLCFCNIVKYPSTTKIDNYINLKSTNKNTSYFLANNEQFMLPNSLSNYYIPNNYSCARFSYLHSECEKQIFPTKMQNGYYCCYLSPCQRDTYGAVLGLFCYHCVNYAGNGPHLQRTCLNIH